MVQEIFSIKSSLSISTFPRWFSTCLSCAVQDAFFQSNNTVPRIPTASPTSTGMIVSKIGNTVGIVSGSACCSGTGLSMDHAHRKMVASRSFNNKQTLKHTIVPNSSCQPSLAGSPLSRLIQIRSDNSCITKMGMQYLGVEPHRKKAQTTELQFRKTLVYIYTNNPAVHASIQFTQLSN